MDLGVKGGLIRRNSTQMFVLVGISVHLFFFYRQNFFIKESDNALLVVLLSSLYSSMTPEPEIVQGFIWAVTRINFENSIHAY